MPEPSLSAVEIFTVLPSRFPEKYLTLMQKNFESHVFEGYYLKVMKKLTYVNRSRRNRQDEKCNSGSSSDEMQ